MYFDQNPSSDASSTGIRSGESSPARILAWLAGLVILFAGTLHAQELQDIRAANLGSGQTQLALRFSAPPPEASIFAIASPPRIALDLPGVSNRMAARTTEIGIGPLLSVTAVEAGDRTRVILNLARNSDYRSHVDGNNLILTVGAGVADAEPTAVAEAPPTRPPGVRSARPPEITDVDFRRGIEGQGRVLVELSRPGITVDVREQAGRVELVFPRVLLDSQLERRLNVVDFATPVTSIDTVREGDDRVRMIVNATGQYDVLSYQTDRTYVLELAPLTEEELEAQRIEQEEYVGERLSLNFQDIEVRSVLQLLADFTDLNIVVSDSVGGNITLRLNNVPWDQALDIILTTRGLDKRVTGNVMYVAPSEEIAARERLILEAQRDRRELEPLRTEFITINFNQATNIRDLIQTRRDDREERVSFLSDRGSVAVDPRTNTLIVRDTQEQIEAIRRLVATLDVPTRQVLIETRVVIADDNYRRDLGVRFGVSGGRSEGSANIGTSGSLEGASGITGGNGIPSLSDRLNVALPVTDGASIGFSILRPNILLDLELSALQTEGRGEVISSPRVITANGQKATISQGE
ncbi:type IV pilus secretin PilQ, partial [Thioalkalivibrio sp.]|uniref:type IV pilus secretin PilQ n=1 Tax=Thioalkalivibrio sp. TaxID=2093813 RepID=UPI003975AB8A